MLLPLEPGAAPVTCAGTGSDEVIYRQRQIDGSNRAAAHLDLEVKKRGKERHSR